MLPDDEKREADEERNVGRVEGISDDGRGDGGGDPRERRDPKGKKKKEPDGGVDERRGPQQSDEDPEQGRNALAAFEAEPDRIEMPDERS